MRVEHASPAAHKAGFSAKRPGRPVTPPPLCADMENCLHGLAAFVAVAPSYRSLTYKHPPSERNRSESGMIDHRQEAAGRKLDGQERTRFGGFFVAWKKVQARRLTPGQSPVVAGVASVPKGSESQ